jgi:hypothetical protein
MVEHDKTHCLLTWASSLVARTPAAGAGAALPAPAFRRNGSRVGRARRVVPEGGAIAPAAPAGCPAGVAGGGGRGPGGGIIVVVA